MAVVLADRDLTARVQSHPWTRDEHGVPVPAEAPVTDDRGPYPGAATEQPDDTWTLRLDPRCWPVRAGDTITDGTLTWVLTGNPRLHQVPGVSDVDYIAATAQLEPPEVP